MSEQAMCGWCGGRGVQRLIRLGSEVETECRHCSPTGERRIVRVGEGDPTDDQWHRLSNGAPLCYALGWARLTDDLEKVTCPRCIDREPEFRRSPPGVAIVIRDTVGLPAAYRFIPFGGVLTCRSHATFTSFVAANYRDLNRDDHIVLNIRTNINAILAWGDGEGHDLRVLLPVDQGGTVTGREPVTADDVSVMLIAASIESIVGGGGIVETIDGMWFDDE